MDLKEIETELNEITKKEDEEYEYVNNGMWLEYGCQEGETHVNKMRHLIEAITQINLRGLRENYTAEKLQKEVQDLYLAGTSSRAAIMDIMVRSFKSYDSMSVPITQENYLEYCHVLFVYYILMENPDKALEFYREGVHFL